MTIKSIQIVDLASGQDVGPITDRKVIRVLPARRSIRVDVDGKPKCVKITINARPWLERIAPFIYGGDKGQDAGPVLDKPGPYTITASVHPDSEARQPPITSLTVLCTVATGALVQNSCEFGLVTQMNQKPKEKDDVPAPVAVAAPAFHKLGVKLLRNMIWLTSWKDIPGKGASGSFKLFKDAGFDITATITCAEEPASTAQVASAIERIHDEYGAVVDRFSIGNEPDLKKYYAGGLRSFFDKVLTPASKVLRRRKAIVLGPGISEDPRELKQLVDYGMLALVDEACFHPYQRTAEAHEAALAQAKEIVGTMPLNATEWNIHAPSPDAWKKAFPAMKRAASQYLKRAFYYRSTARADRPAGKQGLFNAAWTPNEPYYSAFTAR